MLVTILACCLLLLTVYVWYKTSAGNSLSPRGKSVLITGCDSGIGLQLASYLADKDFLVIAACLQKSSLGQAVFQASSNIIPVVMDVTNDESILEVRREILERFSNKELWGLVNNAGVLVYGEFDWLTHEHYMKQIQVNLIGNFKVTKYFLPFLKHAKGRVINITSVNGQCAFPGAAVYSGTKFAVEGFTDALRQELKKFDMKVIAVQPGDYAKLTNIMMQHRRHQDEMWEAMSEDDRKSYGSYFNSFHKHVLENAGMTSPNSLERLLNDVGHALISTNPKIRYTSAPILYQIFYTVFKYLPDTFKDTLIYFLYKVAFKFDTETQ